MLTDEQKAAIKVIAEMVKKTHGYDYVDDSVEIRLYGEARDVFSKTVYPDQED